MKIGKWGETSHLCKFLKKVGRNDFWGETSQGEMSRGETSLGEKRLSSGYLTLLCCITLLCCEACFLACFFHLTLNMSLGYLLDMFPIESQWL